MSNVKQLQSGIMSTEPMELSTNIDWISVTYPPTAHRKENTRVLPDDHHNGYQIVRGFNGYDTALKYKSGAIELWHTQHSSMGIHVVYSAEAIAKSCENFNCEQWEILDYLMQGAKLSRLDIALDVKNVPIDIRQMHADALSGKIKTRVKTLDYVERAKVGQEKGARTLYFGSMTKRKKLLRVYDKGMQLNLKNHLTRFELETHGTIAQNAAKQLMSDVEGIAKTIQGMIRGYADMSQSVPKEIFTSDAIKIALPKYEKSNTAQWLIEVVSKTLAKEAANDYTVMQAFLDKFTQHYQSIIDEKGYN